MTLFVSRPTVASLVMCDEMAEEVYDLKQTPETCGRNRESKL
jgi:hypothetical protein